MAACTFASWALVRVSTAMLDQRRPGVRDIFAWVAAQAASSSSVAWPMTLGTGPSTRVVRGRAPPRPSSENDPPSRSTAVATATTWGVQRWFSSSRMTLVPRKQVGQAGQQGGVGAVEAVDRLVGVADHEEVRLVGQHGGEEAELGGVDVLHLVDEEVAGAPADGVGELRVTRQRVGAGDDQVVEVEEAALGPLHLVAGVRVGHLLGAQAAAAAVPTRLGLVVVGRDEPRLGPTDLPVEGAGAAGVAVRDLGQEAAAVGHELGRRPVAQLAVLAQEAERRAVERAGLHAGDAEGPQARAQLLGRLAAEGGDEGAVGLDRPLADPAGDPEREDPRLAGAGAGDDAEQRFVRLDRLALGHGETVGTGEGLPGVGLEALERHHHTPHGTEGVRVQQPFWPAPMVADRSARAPSRVWRPGGREAPGKGPAGRAGPAGRIRRGGECAGPGGGRGGLGRGGPARRRRRRRRGPRPPRAWGTWRWG